MRRLSIALTLTLLAAPASAQDDPCAGETCSARGECFAERGIAACLCEEGQAAVGLTCVAVEGGADPLRARRAPGIGERVASLAEAQVGRKRHQVRHEDDALTDYLADGEWWCADFVSWVYRQAGVPFDGGAMGGWLLTNNHVLARWFERRGLFHPRGDGYAPEPGDFVRFPTERGGHAGLVVEVRGTTLYTVEGNVNGAVSRERYYHYPDNPLIAGFGQLALDNATPEVEVGADREVLVDERVTLQGSAEDDGPPERLLVTWSADAPDVTIRHASRPEAEVTLPRPGRFALTLAASDGEHTTRETVTLTAVRDDPPQVVLRTTERAPLFAALEAEVFDEGEPALTWRTVDGPGDVDLSDPTSPRPEARFTDAGRYVLALTADDGRHTTEQRLTLDVEAGGLGCAVRSRGAGSSGGMWCVGLLALFVLRRWQRPGAGCGARGANRPPRIGVATHLSLSRVARGAASGPGTGSSEPPPDRPGSGPARRTRC